MENKPLKLMLVFTLGMIFNILVSGYMIDYGRNLLQLKSTLAFAGGWILCLFGFVMFVTLTISLISRTFLKENKQINKQGESDHGK
jgi:hypothetical protein